MIELEKFCKVTENYVFFLNGPFSQWWKSPFKENEIRFVNCEQYMMFHKAKLFNDNNIADKILKEKNPREHKELGRKVSGFNETIWNKNKVSIVYHGNYLKFTQNGELKDFLLSTGNKLLVEANGHDSIWGIGMYENDYNLLKTKMWGQNLLGKILTKVRNDIKEKEMI